MACVFSLQACKQTYRCPAIVSQPTPAWRRHAPKHTMLFKQLLRTEVSCESRLQHKDSLMGCEGAKGRARRKAMRTRGPQNSRGEATPLALLTLPGPPGLPSGSSPGSWNCLKPWSPRSEPVCAERHGICTFLAWRRHAPKHARFRRTHPWARHWHARKNAIQKCC